jgi:catechol 2,3-dioxygenase-like lactoylglutathione lyase family enzyme
MLAAKDAVASIAVNDLTLARRFYEQTLGLEVVDSEGSEAITFKSGTSKVLVYRSRYARTNKATALNFMVGEDLDRIVRGLRDRGVTFEHYDLPGAKLEGDVHTFGNLKNAWFKDPDGNIIALINR